MTQDDKVNALIADIDVLMGGQLVSDLSPHFDLKLRAILDKHRPLKPVIECTPEECAEIVGLHVRPFIIGQKNWHSVIDDKGIWSCVYKLCFNSVGADHFPDEATTKLMQPYQAKRDGLEYKMTLDDFMQDLWRN